MLKLKHFSVLLLLIGFYSSADAAVLCANASGSVFVRNPVCRAGETQLDPVALGLRGPAGADGADGVSGYEVVADDVFVSNGELESLFVPCPAGKVVVGGGVVTAGPQGFVPALSFNTVFQGQSGWAGSVNNTSGGSVQLLVRAICITVADETA